MLAPPMKNVILFLGICIPLRLLLTFLAYKFKNLLPYIGIVFLCMAFGFISVYVTDMRKTGILGQKAWWNELRPVHGVLYLLFAILAFKGKSYSWMILLLDVVIGLFAWIVKQYFIL